MSNSKLVNKTMLTPRNHTKGRSGYKLKKITIHHCAGVMSKEYAEIKKQIDKLLSKENQLKRELENIQKTKLKIIYYLLKGSDE